MTALSPAMLIAAVVTFVATNIDDLVLLTGWFSDRGYRACHIAVGQFPGIAVLVAVSVLLGLAGLFVPIPMMGIPGVIQAGIGISRLIRNRVAGNDYQVRRRRGVTIAHGTDNIAIYVPILATQTTVSMFTTVAMFSHDRGLARPRALVRASSCLRARCPTYGHRIVPWVLILLGASIVYEAGTIG